jgi:FAD/FMN-containing dehydrogenase
MTTDPVSAATPADPDAGTPDAGEPDAGTAFLQLIEKAVDSVWIYRSSFPASHPFSATFDEGVSWLRQHRASVDLRIVVDPLMADPVVFFRVDSAVYAGPLRAPMPMAWLDLSSSPSVTRDEFDEFFQDTARNISAADTLIPYNAIVPLDDGSTQIDDFSRLNATAVHEVVGFRENRWPWSAFDPTIEDWCNIVAEASRTGRPVSISGKRHSQGGHTFHPDGIVLDMTDFDQVLDFDPTARTIRVQGGATWDVVQRFVQPHGLSVSVMQAYPYFTVGGAIGVNAHESDIRFGPIIDTIVSMRVLVADGHVLDVDPDHELFDLVVGGYGLFGVVLEAVLQLTDDLALTETLHTIPLAQTAAAIETARTTPGVIFAGGRPNFVRTDPDFLDQISFTTNSVVDPPPTDPSIYAIQPFAYLGLRKLIYDLSRSYQWGARLKWQLQEANGDQFAVNVVSRNNRMREDIRIPGDHRSATDVDALQEYFVPLDRFADFAARVRTIALEHAVDIMSIGVRFVPRSERPTLSYSAKGDMLGWIMVINHGSSTDECAATAAWTRRVIDAALELGGTYYLPYALYASREQVRRAYPRFDEFVAAKKRWDPQGIFTSRFFAAYE